MTDAVGDDANPVLLVRRADTWLRALSRGRVELGESAVEAAEREVLE
jgi:8-oxo-dGTP pyrophosphatase MutT (NUDIX family)